MGGRGVTRRHKPTNTNTCQTLVVGCQRGWGTPKCLHRTFTLLTCNNKLILAGGRRLSLPSLCVSLPLCTSSSLRFQTFPPTKLSHDREPHGVLLAATVKTENKRRSPVSNFSHVSMETSYCQVWVWLSRQIDQRIRRSSGKARSWFIISWWLNVIKRFYSSTVFRQFFRSWYLTFNFYRQNIICLWNTTHQTAKQYIKGLKLPPHFPATTLKCWSDVAQRRFQIRSQISLKTGQKNI